MTKYAIHGDRKDSDAFVFQSMIAACLDLEALHRMLEKNTVPNDPLSNSIVEYTQDNGFLETFFKKMQEDTETVIFFVNHYAIKLSKVIMADHKSIAKQLAATKAFELMTSIEKNNPNSFFAYFVQAYGSEITKRTCSLIDAIHEINQFTIEHNVVNQSEWENKYEFIIKLLIDATDYLISSQEAVILNPIKEERLKIYTVLTFLDEYDRQPPSNEEDMPEEYLTIIKGILDGIKKAGIETYNDINNRQKIVTLFQDLEVSIPGILEAEKQMIRDWVEYPLQNRHYAAQVIASIDIPAEISTQKWKNAIKDKIYNLAKIECFSFSERRADILEIVTNWLRCMDKQVVHCDLQDIEKNISDHIDANIEFKEELNSLSEEDRALVVSYMRRHFTKWSVIGILAHKIDDEKALFDPSEKNIQKTGEFMSLTMSSPELNRFPKKIHREICTAAVDLFCQSRRERDEAIVDFLRSRFLDTPKNLNKNVIEYYFHSKNNMEKELYELKALNPSFESDQAIKKLETFLELAEWIHITTIVESIHYLNKESVKFKPASIDMSVYPETAYLSPKIQKLILDIISEKAHTYRKLENPHQIFQELSEAVLDDKGVRKLKARDQARAEAKLEAELEQNRESSVTEVLDDDDKVKPRNRFCC